MGGIQAQAGIDVATTDLLLLPRTGAVAGWPCDVFMNASARLSSVHRRAALKERAYDVRHAEVAELADAPERAWEPMVPPRTPSL